MKVFIGRPVASAMLAAAFVLAGAAAFLALPIDAMPSTEVPTFDVTTADPGAGAATIAASVSSPLEQQIGKIPGVSELTSTNVGGFSGITVQFSLGRDTASAMTDLIAAIDAAHAQLPVDLPAEPTVTRDDPADPPIMILAVRSRTLALTEVDDAVESTLLPRLATIEGVGAVGVIGQQKSAVRVTVAPERLAALGLTFEDVRNAVGRDTADRPAGTLETRRRGLTILADDQLVDVRSFGAAIIAWHGGAPIRLRDLAAVTTGPEDREIAGWQSVNGDLARGIQLVISRAPGANAVATVGRIRALLPSIEALMPRAVHVGVVADKTVNIRASLADVERTLLIAIALVVGVVLLSLGSLRATLVASLAVPVSLCASFVAMAKLGLSLDNLSLMGLTLAAGFVIDDAIVMLENIHRHVERGLPPRLATLTGAREMAFTIVSITVSLVVVFAPVLAMQGAVGRLFREFAVTVSIAVVASAAVSLTLTPAVAGRILRVRAGPAVDPVPSRLLRAHAALLEFVLLRRSATLLAFFATLTATGVLFAVIPKGFLPVEDTGFISGLTEAARDTSFSRMVELQAEANSLVRDDPAVASFGSVTGSGDTGQARNIGRFWIYLKSAAERGDIDVVMARLRAKSRHLLGVSLFVRPVQDVNIGARVSKAAFQYALADADAAELDRWAPRLLAAVTRIPILTDVGSDQDTAGGAVALRLERDRAARFGVSPLDIDQVLDDAFGQREVAQYSTGGSSHHLVLEARSSTRTASAQLAMRGRSAAGLPVPLGEVVAVDDAPTTPLTANHDGQLPTVTISFNVLPGASLGAAVNAINQAAATLRTPASVAGSFTGAAAAFEASLHGETTLVAAALIAVYLVLGVLYESATLPLVILSTLPAAGLGALATLMLTGTDFSLIALIGVVLLIGIVKKNGILLVEVAIRLERETGASPLAAIREASLLRVRPILRRF